MKVPTFYKRSNIYVKICENQKKKKFGGIQVILVGDFFQLSNELYGDPGKLVSCCHGLMICFPIKLLNY